MNIDVEQIAADIKEWQENNKFEQPMNTQSIIDESKWLDAKLKELFLSSVLNNASRWVRSCYDRRWYYCKHGKAEFLIDSQPPITCHIRLQLHNVPYIDDEAWHYYPRRFCDRELIQAMRHIIDTASIKAELQEIQEKNQLLQKVVDSVR